MSTQSLSETSSSEWQEYKFSQEHRNLKDRNALLFNKLLLSGKYLPNGFHGLNSVFSTLRDKKKTAPLSPESLSASVYISHIGIQIDQGSE